MAQASIVQAQSESDNILLSTSSKSNHFLLELANQNNYCLLAQEKGHSIYEPNYSSVEVRTRPLVVSQGKLEAICNILEQEFNRGLHRDTNPVADIKMYPTHICDHKPASSISSSLANGQDETETDTENSRFNYENNDDQDDQDEHHFATPDEGKFLALDLGGTNFRVILVTLEKDNFHMENKSYSLSKDLMRGPGSQLFDYIANCLHLFVMQHNVEGQRLPLGFTFSFPCEQDNLSHARLVAWTKGFTCSGVEGRDVCQLLREAIKRRSDLDIEVMAVLNDTVGTLISCAHQNRECRLGLIVGTGTNACYMEKLNHVHRMISKQNSTIQLPVTEDTRTVVNTEWGAFGDNGSLDFIRTKWDQELDEQCEGAGRQRFEKMIGGLYVGELCRRVIVDMALNQGLIFNNNNPVNKPQNEIISNDKSDSNANGNGNCNGNTNQLLDYEEMQRRREILNEGTLKKSFSFPSKFVSLIESDSADQYENTRIAIDEAFAINWASDQDCASIKLICARVSTRAAHLVAAAVACLLNKMQRKHTVVGVDGSMFRCHPHFKSLMANKTKQLTRPQYQFQLMFAEDGSGRGAALMAAIACRQRRISSQLQISQQNHR